MRNKTFLFVGFSVNLFSDGNEDGWGRGPQPHLPILAPTPTHPALGDEILFHPQLIFAKPNKELGTQLEN